MLSVLPLLFLLLAGRLAAAWRRTDSLSFDWRDSILIGAVCTGVWAFAGAELLSIFHQFAPRPVLAWWAAGVVLLAGLILRTRQGSGSISIRPDRDRINLVFILLALVVLFATGAMAYLTPPTTPDSLGYHLPRQMYWIENRAIFPYPCADGRQLEMPPLAEYIGAQLMLLSGTDHQANLVQWCAFLMCALGASAIARDLGAGPRGQSFAALFALLSPAAATQAENAKNDVVVAMWAIVLMWCAVRVWIPRRISVRDGVFVGATLGLLLLTKGTAYAVAPPICAVAAVGFLRCGLRRGIAIGTLTVVVAVGINAPHMGRNLKYCGSPLGVPASRGGFDLGNSAHTPAILASNLVRNLSLHTSTPSARINEWEHRLVDRLHAAIGIDPADARTTSPRGFPFSIGPNWSSDGNNGAPVHLVLGLAMVIAVRPGRFAKRPVWPIFLVPYAAALLFALLLKWQPWHARLHIPIVATVCPLLGVWLHKRPWIVLVAVVPAAFVASSALLWNEFKPIAGPHSVLGKARETVLFDTYPLAIPDCRPIVEKLAMLRPGSVAIDIDPYYCEYTLLRGIRQLPSPVPHVSVFRPVWGPVPSASAPPDVVISYRRANGRPMYHAPSKTLMTFLTEANGYYLYVPSAVVDNSRRTIPAPDFYGWQSESGLKAAEGPYPQFDLPVVRWAEKKVMSLSFESDGKPMALIMECRRNDTASQVMIVKHNGKEVHRFEFGDIWAFLPFNVPLEPAKGPNVLTFEFANINEPGASWAVLFRRLQIIPASWIEPNPAKPSSPPTPNP